MPLPLINSAAINGEMGSLSVGADSYFYAASIYPATLGIPSIQVGAQKFLADSLHPVTIGLGEILLGLSPVSRYFYADSIEVTTLGVPGLAAHVTFAAEGLSPARLGIHGLAEGFTAASLSPTQFGSPSTAVGLEPASLSPVTFGVPGWSVGFPAASLSPASFGVPKTLLGGLTLPAESLQPVSFGVPGSSGTGFSAFSLYPVRLGTHALGRGNTC